MNDQDKPMPLSELPAYLNSVRERGQGDYVPVVDMGRIVDAGGSTVWFRRVGYAAALFMLLAGGFLTYAVSATREITIVSDGMGAMDISGVVSNEGGRVISVRKDEEGAYRVRVFAFGGVKSLVERLRENRGLDRVELKE